MRQAYRELSLAEKAAMQKLKADAAAIYDDIVSFGNSRELSVAKTKLEEAVMWAVKHLTGSGLPIGVATTNLEDGGSGQGKDPH